MAFKNKTHSGAKKRFRLLPSGKVKGGKAHKRHLLTKKSSQRKRNLSKTYYVGDCDIHKIRPLL